MESSFRVEMLGKEEGREEGGKRRREEKESRKQNSPVEERAASFARPKQKVSRSPRGVGHPASEPESEKRREEERRGRRRWMSGRRETSKT